MTERLSGSLSGFAALLDGLSYAGGRNAKLKLMADWLRETPDPDRGWGLAALTGGLDLPSVKPALIRALIEERVDPLLFRLSYDYVGDLAETVSLLWPGDGGDATAQTDADGTVRHGVLLAAWSRCGRAGSCSDRCHGTRDERRANLHSWRTSST